MRPPLSLSLSFGEEGRLKIPPEAGVRGNQI